MAVFCRRLSLAERATCIDCSKTRCVPRRRYGKPHLFVTFARNVHWPEIQSSLFESQTANDRPDIVCRVFRLKVFDMIDVIVKKESFGTVLACVQTIEFQKRGLPHITHMLFILSGRQHCWQEVDRFVSAELPDPAVHQRLHKVVNNCMLHGVCGPGSSCYKDGRCSKSFPKPFRMGDDSYPLYRRRSPQDGGKTFTKYNRGQAVVVDNRWVVPYNATLQRTRESRYCASVKAVKYLYIFKGHDRAVIAITADNSSLTVNDSVTNEIKNYIDCRYIGAMEAVWRIFHFPLHDRHPAVQSLQVHLEHQQSGIFQDGQAEAVVTKGEPRTTLTEFFHTNSTDPAARHFLYHEFPEHYSWNTTAKRWLRRKRASCTIGVMYTSHQNQGDLYYLRLLLLHVRGPTTFSELRTVGNDLCETFKDVCLRLNLLEDDAEWRECLRDAVECRMPFQLRLLFVCILLFCEPADPLCLFQHFATDMTEDFMYTQAANGQNKVLLTIERLLTAHGRSLSDFKLPVPVQELSSADDVCDDQQDAGAADYLAVSEPLLNDDQRQIYDRLCHAVDNNTGGIYFLDAPGAWRYWQDVSA